MRKSPYNQPVQSQAQHYYAAGPTKVRKNENAVVLHSTAQCFIFVVNNVNQYVVGSRPFRGAFPSLIHTRRESVIFWNQPLGHFSSLWLTAEYAEAK